jgi:hypothetical protein
VKALSRKDQSMLRWCALTVSKGFTAEHDGQINAHEVVQRFDAAKEFPVIRSLDWELVRHLVQKAAAGDDFMAEHARRLLPELEAFISADLERQRLESQ